MDITKSIDAIIGLINATFYTLMELELSNCNLSLENLMEIFECLIESGVQEAKDCNDGFIRGTLRTISFADNPALPRQ